MTRKCADQTDKKDWEAQGMEHWAASGWFQVWPRESLKSFARKTENATFSRMNTTEPQHTMLILGKDLFTYAEISQSYSCPRHVIKEKRTTICPDRPAKAPALGISCSPVVLHRFSRSSPSSISIWLTAPDLPFSATVHKLFPESQRPWASWVCVFWTFLDLLVALFYLVELWQQFL